MKSRNGLPALLLSLAFHAATGFILAVHFPELALPAHWLHDALICMAVSGLLACVPLVLPSTEARVLVFGLRILLFVLLMLPLGRMLWLVLGLAFALTVDMGIQLPARTSAALGGVVLGLSLLRGILPVHAWNQDVSGRFTAENLFGCLALGLVYLLVQSRAILDAALRKSQETIGQLNDSILVLTSANQGFLNYASEVERASILNERNRLTREMHDILGHTLTNVRMMMEAAIRREWEDKEELRQLHQWIRDQTQQGLQETRTILGLIRGIEEPETKGVSAIQHLIRTFMDATKVNVKVDWGNVPWSWQNDYLNITVFRVIQESMTNAFRHGHATEIGIYFFQEESALNIRIEDNGSGSGDFTKGIGLTGMEERLKPLGGTITASGTDMGFRLLVRIPIGLPVHPVEA